MSELTDAWRAVHERHEAMGDSPDMRPLLMGMDVDIADIEVAAVAFAEEATGESVYSSQHALDMAAAWADGFTVGAMLFLKRLES